MKKQSLLALAALFLTIGVSPAHASDDGGVAGRIGSYPGYNSHLSQNAELIVRKLYRGMLFREPRSFELSNAAYTIRSQGEAGLADLAFDVGSSPEFYQNVSPRHRNLDIVRNLYRELLNRQGDPAGIQFWVHALDQGMSGDVLKGFVQSEEFRRLYVY